MNADNSHANGPQPSRSAEVLASIALAVHGCGFPGSDVLTAARDRPTSSGLESLTTPAICPEGGCMAIVTLDVRPLEDTLTDLAQVCTIGQPDTGPRISFAMPALLWQVLTARRWDLLKALTGQTPMSLREVARRAGCDVKAVHGDVHALLRP